MRMKKKDMRLAITAGTVVAVDESYRKRGAFPMNGVRAAILAVDEPRTVHSGERWDTGGHTVKDGVRVSWIENRNEQGFKELIAGTEAVVGPSAVLGAWVEYEPARAEEQAKRDAVKDRLETERELADRAAEVLGGKVATRRSRDSLKALGYEVILSPQVAAEVAGRLGPPVES